MILEISVLFFCCVSMFFLAWMFARPILEIMKNKKYIRKENYVFLWIFELYFVILGLGFLCPFVLKIIKNLK